MSDPREPDEAQAPGPCHAGAAEKPPGPEKPAEPTREARLAKALRENLRRRKARIKKD